MKKIFSFLWLVLMYSHIFSQSGWFGQNPLPTGNTIMNLKFTNLNTGFMVGDCNSILKTTNAGVTWKYLNSPVFNHYTEAQFLDDNTGFIAGNYSMIKTTNGGANWFTVYLHDVESISFVDQNTGYAVTYNDLLIKTTDGGSSWVNLGYLSANNSIEFLNSNTGFSAWGNISKTTNGGVNWYIVAGGLINIFSMYFVNNYSGYAVGGNGIIMNTTDGGENWNSQNSGTTAYLRSVYFTSVNTGYCVGYRAILKTTNGGLSWSLQNPGNHFLHAVNFVNSYTGYASGYKGHSLKTTDSGNTWLSLNSGPTVRINKVQLTSANTGYCAGDSGLLMTTLNGGANWVIQNTNTSSNLRSLFFLNDYTGYIAGDSGKILKTTDSGQNWQGQNSGTSNNLLSVFFASYNIGYVSGNNGIILKTTNGGISWSTLTSGMTDGLNSIYFVDLYEGYSAGGRYIIKTTNSGDTWFSIYCNSGSNCNLMSIDFSTLQTGFVVGGKQDNIFPYAMHGIVIKTTDSGNNWTVFEGLYRQASSIYFTDLNNGYITSGENLWRTFNGGDNWFIYDCVSRDELYSVHFLDANTGFTVGNYGMIFKTTDGGQITGITYNENEVPSLFSLSQNYPNPFNPNTAIKYTLSKDVFVIIKVYDILGNEIKTIVNEFRKAGYYVSEFDGTNLASGVYFYRIEAEESNGNKFVDSKKMVLLK